MAYSVDDILERLGGAEAVSRLTGVGAEAIRKWRQARAIPPKHWASLSAAAGIAINELPRAVTEAGAAPAGATAALVLADGTVFWGTGFGANTPPGGGQPAEICFSTGMTGYQETLTDPSFAGQVIVFTFPHIGNVGANAQDIEATTIAARGLVIKQDMTEPSNWRSTETLNAWLRKQNVPGIAGIDTLACAHRTHPRPAARRTVVLCFPTDGRFDLPVPARGRPRLAGSGGYGPGPGGQLPPDVCVGRNHLDVAGRLLPNRPPLPTTWLPSTMAPSAIFCARWPLRVAV